MFMLVCISNVVRNFLSMFEIAFSHLLRARRLRFALFKIRFQVSYGRALLLQITCNPTLFIY